MLALTARLPNEARAGMLAIGVLILWMLATAGLADPSVPPLAFAVSPFSLVYGYSNGFIAAPPLVLVLAVQVVILSLLWLWTSRRLVARRGGELMRQAASLIWKEWRESRTYLWIAIGVFIGLPVISGVEAIFQHWRRFEVSTSPWVLAFGGVLAVFVAVGATCRDFNGHLDDFWRSRPISTTRWMLMKYFVGLVVVLAACLLPPIVELGINRWKDALPEVLPLVVCFPFIWTALYSVGFLSGCLVRRTAHAAMLGLAALLLVNFLPMVLPPLHWLDVSATVPMTIPDLSDWQRVSATADHWRQLELLMRLFGPLLKFAGGMLGIAIVALSLALLAVRRGWRIDSGRKMMYGSVSAAVLILVASAAFQLGTSLSVLQQMDMPNGERIIRLAFDGHRGYAISEPRDEIGHYNLIRNFFYRTVELTASGIKLGEPEESDGPALVRHRVAARPTGNRISR